jgi:hypothetical protein
MTGLLIAVIVALWLLGGFTTVGWLNEQKRSAHTKIDLAGLVAVWPFAVFAGIVAGVFEIGGWRFYR